MLCQHARQLLRTAAKACLVLGLAAAAHAQSNVAVPTDQNPVVPLAQRTDQQIGVLLQRWPQLDAIQRRDLLAEVRKRMHLAKKAEATVNNNSLQSRVPSLTLRIKRAQSQHSYGRVSNRVSGSQSQQLDRRLQNQPSNPDAPPDMVIRTTVTQILPDGSRVVREQTLVPRVQPYLFRKRLPAPASAPVNPQAASAGSSAKAMPGKVRVIRTTVRFGAGFDQRSRRAADEDRSRDDVRRVSSPQRETLQQRIEGTER